MPRSEHPPAGPLTEQERTEKILGILGIPVEKWEEIQRIGHMVGGDWGMEIAMGDPGKGSHFNPALNRIQLDPLHIADPDGLREAEFTSAHEGGHRAITRSPVALGMTEEKEIELYNQLGFGFGANSLEDPAENDWWSRKYEGLGDSVRGIYDQQLADENAVLGTPEIHKLIALRGSPPRYAIFGSEFIRYWHQRRFANNLPPEVMAALERVKKPMERYFTAIPDNHPTENEVQNAARKRFTIFHDVIWPEMKKLVEMDQRDEELRLALTQDQLKLEDWLKEILKKIMQETGKRAADKIEEEAKKTADQLRKDAQALREAAKKYDEPGS